MGITLIILGLIYILLQRTQWHKNYVIKHNFSFQEDVLSFIRNVIGGFFIFLGILLLVL